MFGLGTWELVIVLVVLLLLFGSRLPSVMRGLGKSVTEFKKGMNDITEEPQQTRPAPQQPQQPQDPQHPQNPMVG
jgi:sec-independent protein translocase protein TatA